jgi:hypothetical protein
MCVAVELIDELQRAYFAGRDLGSSVRSFNETEAAVIVAESLEADRLVNMPPEKLYDGSFEPLFGPVSDWPRAVMAELFFAMADTARDLEDRSAHRNTWSLAWASLEESLNSPFASPLLWYEDMFFDVGHQLRTRGDRDAVDFFKRSLAHDLRFDDGMNAVTLLMDVAETYLWVGDADAGLEILVGLLRHDPSNIWIYNLMAIAFEQFELAEIGAEAAQRGLELVEATGDPENVRGQLRDALDELEESERRGREAEVDPRVLAELRDALALDFDAGEHRSVDALSHALVPDLDQMPVMRPAENPDLPPPDELMERLGMPSPRGARRGRDLGRNDPCWCGSGKKYKHCHLRSDQRRR